MKESLGDKIVDKMKERLALTRTKLHSTYKTTKPFRMQPISSDKMLEQYNMLTSEDMSNLLGQFPREEIGQYIMKMEQLKQRRMQNA